MRGTGTLRSIIGKPLYPSRNKRDEAEPDLVHQAPAKKQRQQSKSAGAAGAGTAPGQKSLFNFYQVAAPPAAANAQTDNSLSRVLRPSSAGTPAGPAAAAANATCRSSSAPVLLSRPSSSNNTSNSNRAPAEADTPAGQDRSLSSQGLLSSSQSPEERGVSPPSPSQAGQVRSSQGPLVVTTRVVGRQHQSTAWPPAPGCSLQLVREASNPVDPCAFLVCSVDSHGTRRSHGHLPASVACHLAPLLDSNKVAVTVQLASTAAGVEDADPEAAAAAAEDEGEVPAGGRAEKGLQQPVAGDMDGVAAAAGRAQEQQDTGAQRAQEQQALQLHLELLEPEGQSAEAAAGVTLAISQAASAGLASLAPVLSSGAVLAAAFDHILSETRLHDLHLLSQAEQQVLQNMQLLPAASKALLLHLLLRKRTWFQLSSLNYADVPQPEAAARRLSAVGLLQWDSDPRADLHALLQELPVVLLKQVLATLLPRGHPAIAAAAAAASAGAGRGPNKMSVLSSIQAIGSRAKLHAAMSAAAGPCVTVTPAAAGTFARLQRLYFATPGHDLSMFLAVQRGAVSYPSYPIQRTRPIFSSRQQLLDYEAALDLAGRVDAALEEGDMDEGWRLLQQALSALQAGVHKGVVWDEACAPMPNPPPRQQPADNSNTADSATPAPASDADTAGAPAAAAAAAECMFVEEDVQEQHMGQALQHVHSAPAILHKQQQQQVSKADVAGLHAHPSAQQPAASAGTTLAPASSRSKDRQPAVAAVSSVGISGSLGQVSSSVAHCCRQSADSSDSSWDTSDMQEDEATAADIAAAAGSALEQQDQGVRSEMQAAEPAAKQQAGAQGPEEEAAVQVEGAAAAAAGAGAAAGNAERERDQPPLFFARFCAGWVHASLGTVAVSRLEKQKRWEDAVELLRLLLGGNACVGRRGEWWTRLAINLEHLGRTEDALEAVEAALADAWVRWGDLLGLQRRYLRLAKPPRRWKRPPWAQAVAWEPPEVVITARPLNNTTGTKSRFYAPDNSQVTVEQLALQHYASEEAGGWQGLHCEGGVWAALFTLLLWDVIFMGVPDVFRGPFQTCPLDLDTDAFYPARSNQLDAALARIADGHAGAMLQAVWAAHAGVMARGINWQRFTQQQLLEICDCLGGLGLAAVLRLMAEDHAGAAGGLPDLLLWRPADKSAKVVEVKGPRDKLSHQQRFWLARMADNTLQVEVLKVKEPQSNKRKT